MSWILLHVLCVKNWTKLAGTVITKHCSRLRYSVDTFVLNVRKLYTVDLTFKQSKNGIMCNGTAVVSRCICRQRRTTVAAVLWLKTVLFSYRSWHDHINDNKTSTTATLNNLKHRQTHKTCCKTNIKSWFYLSKTDPVTRSVFDK